MKRESGFSSGLPSPPGQARTFFLDESPGEKLKSCRRPFFAMAGLSRVVEGTGPMTPQQPDRRIKVLIPARDLGEMSKRRLDQELLVVRYRKASQVC